MIPTEGVYAMQVCGLAERFGQNPLDVEGWPMRVLRLIETDGLMREARKDK